MNGKQYLAAIHDLPCVLCRALEQEQTTRTEAHHTREGQGMSQRAQDWLAIAICTEHHTGRRGIHGDKSALRQAKLDEMDLLALTIEAMN
jgi:hypothetical protein